MQLFASVAFISAVAPLASAHGWLRSITLDSKVYSPLLLPAAKPDFTAPAPSIMRQIGSDGPVLNVSNSTITCNYNAVPLADNGVSRTATVTAGSNISLYWQGWPHSGPILTYMARCANDDCGTFWGTEGSVWFKVNEYGYRADEGGWATQKLNDDKYVWNVTVPACLAAGEYLVRHEIIAMSDCSKLGKCQFYPSCTQVRVIGGGGVSPSGSQLVAFPGAYTPTGTGILWDTNTQSPEDYVPPGPRVWSCPS